MALSASVFMNPPRDKYWYNYNATINILRRASNTKLFTLYAGMKYLGDSLTGLIKIHGKQYRSH